MARCAAPALVVGLQRPAIPLQSLLDIPCDSTHAPNRCIYRGAESALLKGEVTTQRGQVTSGGTFHSRAPPLAAATTPPTGRLTLPVWLWPPTVVGTTPPDRFMAFAAGRTSCPSQSEFLPRAAPGLEQVWARLRPDAVPCCTSATTTTVISSPTLVAAGDVFDDLGDGAPSHRAHVRHV